MQHPLMNRSVIGWIIYDLASTVFSYAVVTRYFNEWMIVQQHQPDILITSVGFCVSLLLVLSMPFWGTMADRRGQRKPYLLGFTLLAACATALLSIVGWIPASLVLAGLALYGYYSAMAHYDPLLATVAAPKYRPLASGLSAGIGYIGVAISLVVLSVLVPEGESQAAFLPAAAMMLCFTIPIWRWTKEGKAKTTTLLPVKEGNCAVTGEPHNARSVVREALRDVGKSVSEAKHGRHGRFLVARFLYVEAIGTVLAYIAVYAHRVANPTDAQITKLMAIAVGASIVGALTAGWLAKRYCPRRVLSWALILAMGVLIMLALPVPPSMIWFIGPLVGTVLGAIGATDRVIMLQLTEEHHRGRAFGLYALVGRVSSGVGPLICWGAVIAILHNITGLVSLVTASRISIGLLAICVFFGYRLLQTVRMTPEVATTPVAELPQGAQTSLSQ